MKIVKLTTHAFPYTVKQVLRDFAAGNVVESAAGYVYILSDEQNLTNLEDGYQYRDFHLQDERFRVVDAEVVIR